MSNTGYPSIDKKHNDGESFFKKNQIIPSMSIYNMLGMISSFYRDAIAVDCLDLRVTYQELLDTADILARSFKELGIKKGDIVVASMPNYFQAIAVYLASNKIGAITSFLNPGCTKEEIKHYLNEFESPLYVNYDKNNEYNEEIKKDTKIRQIITLNKEHVNIKTFNEIKKGDIGYNDFLSFNDMKIVADYYRGFINPIQSGKNDSLILFTSGSTGNPKSVVLTNQNLIASGLYMKNTGNIVTKKGEKCLICVPFSYPYGFATSTIMSLICGREAILTPGMDINTVDYFMKKNPNYIFGSPAVLELIMRATSDNIDLSSAHSFISGGDFLSPSKAEEAIEWFKKHNSNIEMFNGSGNAETAGASTIAVGSPIKRDTVGKVLVGSSAAMLKIGDDGKLQKPYEEVKYGEEGILCIGGKHVFKGYYNDFKLTAENMAEYNGKKYMITGAVGFLDEEGYFHMTGRASRFYIKADSNKVYLEHLQIIMNSLDIVDECIAVKRPNDEELYDTKVFVKLKNGIEPSEDLKNYIYLSLDGLTPNDSTRPLKSFEMPASIEFVDEIKRIQDSEKLDYRYYEIEAQKEIEEQKKFQKKLLK
ncbi:MAG: class I adenylate-forming enzyme family protein [Bacilli bacterium]